MVQINHEVPNKIREHLLVGILRRFRSIDHSCSPEKYWKLIFWKNFSLSIYRRGYQETENKLIFFKQTSCYIHVYNSSDAVNAIYEPFLKESLGVVIFFWLFRVFQGIHEEFCYILQGVLIHGVYERQIFDYKEKNGSPYWYRGIGISDLLNFFFKYLRFSNFNLNLHRSFLRLF